MPTLREYFAPSADGQDFAGVRRIPIRTAKGTFSVWTKRVGNNPRKKVLLLHGGPGGGHEFLEPLEPWLGAEGVEYYHYDQLGSAFSDQPDDPRYMELLFPHYLSVYMCRLPVWPDGLNRAVLRWNRRVREVVFGLGMLTLAGRLAGWDRSADLHRIDVPTLFMGSTFDAFDPGHARWMSTQVKHGSYHHCANGSHCAAWDDQAAFASGLLTFLEAVDQGKRTVRYEGTANP